MANFIELIAKIKQKNNGTFKLVDAQDVECEEGKGLDEVLNEKLDKNLGAENSDKVLITDAEGNIITQNKEDFEGGGTSDYNDLENKPQINGVELSGNQSGNNVGLVNNQQGIENAGKVLGIGQDGLVVPVENAGASDNIIYKDVAKQLNPNITDSFQRAMWNLKLYGQSTQGADPSPTNPQEITAISEFEGAPIVKNLFPNTPSYEKTYNGNTFNVSNGEIKVTGSGNYTLIDYMTGDYLGGYAEYLNDETYINYYGNKTLFPINAPLKIVLDAVVNNQGGTNTPLMTIILIDKNFKRYNMANVLDNGTVSKSSYSIDNIRGICILLWYNKERDYVINNVMLYANGVDNEPYEPYQAQPFTYTPSRNMYSTQDGSIADYVDVEKGVEVYNMIKQTLTTENVWTQYTANDSTRPFGKCYTMTLDFPFVNNKVMCDYLPYVQFAWQNATKPSISLSNYGGKVWVLCVVEYETLEEFTQWLSSNPITIVFQANVPTEIPIDPIQLAILRALYTYNGVTNFLCNAPVSFTYERSLQIVINNLENAINQTNANILLGGTL